MLEFYTKPKNHLIGCTMHNGLRNILRVPEGKYLPARAPAHTNQMHDNVASSPFMRVYGELRLSLSVCL